MNLRKLLLLTWMFTLGQASLLAQAGNPGDALQKAYEAMVAAKKAYENIQHSIDSLRWRRPIVGRDVTFVPVVPPDMLKRCDDAWARYQEAKATYYRLKGPRVFGPNAYKDVEQIHAALRTHSDHPDKFLDWLKAQNVDINHEEVRTNLLTLIKSNKEPYYVLRMLIHYGPRASSYRDELLTFAKSEPVKNQGEAIGILLVSALVNIDPSTRQQLTQITKSWISGQSFRSDGQRRSLHDALAGHKDPFAHYTARSRGATEK